MCGITGYVGRKTAAPILVDSLKRLEYRGYDSCGIAGFDGEEIYVKKDIGKIAHVDGKLDFSTLKGNLGIGHTRWATHGGVTKENAHPHTSCDGSIAVVHNGIISNHSALRKELESKGHKFTSDTDTEVFAHLIEEFYEGDLKKAVENAISKVEGTYAMLAITKNEETIVCAKKESPLLVGMGEDEVFIGSDISSFLPHTKLAVPVEDGEIVVVNNDGFKIFEGENEIVRQPMEIDWDADMAKKDGFDHFMLKEINEQPKTIMNALKYDNAVIEQVAQMIKDAKRTYIVATGTSLHAGMTAEYWFAKMGHEAAIPVDSSEFENKAFVDEDTLVICITQSGETYDTLRAVKWAQARGAKVVSVVNILGSTASRIADVPILQGSGLETAVCASKTFTSQLAVMLRIAMELAKKNGGLDPRVLEEADRLPQYLEAVLDDHDHVRCVAETLCDAKNYLFISNGTLLASANEAALKFKEITYLHAEGMSGGFLKHGTISLIDDDMHTIALVPPKDAPNREMLLGNISEVKARNGRVIAFSTEPVENADETILVPDVPDFLAPIVYAPAYQLLAYFKSAEMGNDVDKPRALAKSVTVG